MTKLTTNVMNKLATMMALTLAVTALASPPPR